MKYDEDPNTCEVLVTTSSAAETGSASTAIYAYNEIGEETSALLNISIVENGDEYPDPVINAGQSITVAPGETSSVTFTGQNITAWSHGELPSEIVAVNMSESPNTCEVFVTASSAVESCDRVIMIYAHNEVGETREATLNVLIRESGNNMFSSLRSRSGCNAGFAGLSVLILSMMFFKTKDKK